MIQRLLENPTVRMIRRILEDPIARVRVGRLHIEAGWFSGENRRLLQLVLLEQIPDGAPLIIINLTILKFSIEIDLETKR